MIVLLLQAMGRVGEVICRTWQTADKMKKLRGRLAEEMVNMIVHFLYSFDALKRKEILITFEIGRNLTDLTVSWLQY